MSSGSKVGRVLIVEGGGLRGAFSAGALSELERLGGLDFDLCLATSAGAPSAAYLLTGQIEDAVHIWRHFTSGSQLIDPARVLRRKPMMDLDRLLAVFHGIVPLRLERLPETRALYVTVTNCHTAEAEYLRLSGENAFDLLRATMALPVAYGRTVSIGGTPYIDGGLADSVPIETALSYAPERITVVLTQPAGYTKRPVSRLAKLLGYYYRRYPALARAFMRRHQTYNESVRRVEALAASGQVNLIRPIAPLPASRLSRDKALICDTIEAGRQAARVALG